MYDLRNKFINQYEVFQKHLILCYLSRSNYIGLAATVIDSLLKMREYKYKIKKDINSFIKNDLESYSNDDSEKEKEV